MENKITKLIDLNWHKLRWLQGELKKISKENIEKIKNSFRENGFVQPFFVWKDNDGEYWILDGHHRIKVLKELEKENVNIPEKLPAIEIEAETREQAAKLVLIYSSSYAGITEKGIVQFIDDFNLDIEGIKKEIRIDSINVEDIQLSYLDKLAEPQFEERTKTFIYKIYVEDKHNQRLKKILNKLQKEEMQTLIIQKVK